MNAALQTDEDWLDGTTPNGGYQYCYNAIADSYWFRFPDLEADDLIVPRYAVPKAMFDDTLDQDDLIDRAREEIRQRIVSLRSTRKAATS